MIADSCMMIQKSALNVSVCAACEVTTPAVGAHAALKMTGHAMDDVASVTCDAGFEFAVGKVTQDVRCEPQGWNTTGLQPCRQGEVD